VYNFTAKELAECIDIATKRSEGKVLNNVHDKIVDPGQTSFQSHYHGVMAEWAWADLLEVEIDRTWGLKGDGGVYDLICNGTTIQVKLNIGGYRTEYMYAPPADPFKAETIAMATLRGSAKVEYAGWLTRDRFYEIATKFKMLQPEPVDVVNSKALWPPVTISPEEIGLRDYCYAMKRPEVPV
jgi:hypothetical protein